MQCHLYALCSANRVISVCQYGGYHLAVRVLSLLITNALRCFCITIGVSSLVLALYLPDVNILMSTFCCTKHTRIDKLVCIK